MTPRRSVTTFPGFITLIQDGDGALPRIVHSATIGHGNSGGPLLDLCGRALGVNTLKNTGDADIGYVVSNALASKGLMTFLDANNIAYQTIGRTVPGGDSPKPAPTDKTPVAAPAAPAAPATPAAPASPVPGPPSGATAPSANKK